MAKILLVEDEEDLGAASRVAGHCAARGPMGSGREIGSRVFAPKHL